MSAAHLISMETARRFIIRKQHLDSAPKPDVLATIRDLGCLQLDPIRKVERPHRLILWSRLGAYDPAELERLRWQSRALFEYWAHAASLVLSEDYPIHAATMQRNREAQRSQEWLAEHDLYAVRDHVLARLRDEGALKSSDFEHDGATAEYFTGWTSSRAINRVLDYLWHTGAILVSRREGNQRYWDLAERCLPEWVNREALSPYEASYAALQRAVKGLGLAKNKAQVNMHYTRNRYWHYDEALAQLRAEGTLLLVQVEGWAGEWMLHVDDLPLLQQVASGDFQPRTTLLSPFDNLICDRSRTELVWDFHYRIEIYVPKDKRQYGYYVLPILHGERLIGRMDMAYDRKTHTLHIPATYAEDHAPDDPAPIRAAVESLADFLGAEAITYGEPLPAQWRALPG